MKINHAWEIVLGELNKKVYSVSALCSLFLTNSFKQDEMTKSSVLSLCA